MRQGGLWAPQAAALGAVQILHILKLCPFHFVSRSRISSRKTFGSSMLCMEQHLQDVIVGTFSLSVKASA